MRSPIAAAFTVLLAGGCYSAEMDPGEACGSCHGEHAQSFGAAGTVYATARANADDGIEDARIDIVDATGDHVTMQTNAAGNFFTNRHLTPPFRVTLARAGVTVVMPSAPHGDCNACHVTRVGAPGRIHVP